MKRTLLACATLLFVAACTTPSTTLKNPKTGQIATCGGTANGSIVGGAIGYHVQKSNDEDCVKKHQAQGFKIIETKE